MLTHAPRRIYLAVALTWAALALMVAVPVVAVVLAIEVCS